MNNSARSFLTIATLLGLAGCSSSDGDGNGAFANLGGLGGGPLGSGGNLVTGAGAMSVGPGTGAVSASGSATGQSGSSGSNAASGSPGASGSNGAGGSPGGSGATGSGGASSGGASSGAAPGAGGACTDTPPPNGDTCAHAVQYGWCGQSWLNGACAISCKVCSGPGSGGGSGSGGNASGGNGSGGVGKGGTMGNGGTPPGNGGTPPGNGGTQSGTGGYPPIVGGSNGWASRYWDCCKPACGWKANVHAGNPTPSCNQSNQSNGGNYDVQSACNGGDGYMCWNGAPWAVNDNVAYGFAAASGGNYSCGRCYEIQFTGTGHSGANVGAMSIKGKTMIVQVLNNGGVNSDQFDILIPGGGVGAQNACTKQWNGADLGMQYGGYLAECNGDKSCVQQKCNTVFAGKTDLLAGCNWFLTWYNAADNPNLVFKQIACPAAITQRSGLQDPG